MPVLRGELDRFIPYSWETPSSEIAEKYGLRPKDIVRMDLNTSPFRPVKWLAYLSKKIRKMDVNLYPDTTYRSLREALSIYTGKNVDEILVGNGADECLMMVAQAYVGRDDHVVVSSPSYSYFRVCAEIMGGKVVKVPRKPDFSDDLDAILSAAENSKVIFLCSPNNPTGNLVERRSLVRILDETEAVVVVDEAYYEYCGKTFAGLTSSYSNLVVVRTFSKAFSMAGVRVGYALAAKETVNQLNRVRPPNSLSVISLALAEHALKNVQDVRRWVGKVVKERDRVKEVLERDGRVKVFDSKGNFLLLKLKNVDAKEVHERLMRAGIVVRDLSETVENCLRITILTKVENDRFIKTFKAVLDESFSEG
ncbi:MAG: histidinol-phosphate transaminase [Candidatus Caldarchaeum sp.]|nr:histidinol-phosphate transaminase [Candidatus Caldarchaeum sp.]